MNNDKTVLVEREIATDGNPTKNDLYKTSLGDYFYNVRFKVWTRSFKYSEDDTIDKLDITHWYEELPLSKLMEEELSKMTSKQLYEIYLDKAVIERDETYIPKN